MSAPDYQQLLINATLILIFFIYVIKTTIFIGVGLETIIF